MGEFSPVTTTLQGDRHLQLHELLKPICLFEMIFERNQSDEFCIRLSISKDGRSPFSDRDLVITTPIGTEWMQALGKHSYYVIPFVAAGALFVSIGIETVVRHVTRGAYPVSRGYIFPLDDRNPNSELSSALEKLIGYLLGAVPRTFSISFDDVPRFGEFQRPESGRSDIDAAMLAHAAGHYLYGKPFFLRTLLLAPSLHPKQVFRSLDGPPQLEPVYCGRSGYLVGSAPDSDRSLPMRPGWSPLRWLRRLRPAEASTDIVR